MRNRCSKKKQRFRGLPSCTGNKGGAAMEYIIVSTFAAVASMAAIGFIAKVFKEKLTVMGEKLGVEIDTIELNPFGGDE